MRSFFLKSSVIFFNLFLILFGGVNAQQNLFNVPSSDITLKGKMFFQQQFNLTSNAIQLNSTFCYGVWKNAEIGFNVLGVNVNPAFKDPFILTNGDKESTPTYPFYTMNFQQAVVLNKTFKLSAGMQAGFSKGGHAGEYAYLNLISILGVTNSKLITGVYQGSNLYFGKGERNALFPDLPLGLQFGIEQPIIKEKFSLIVENISGKHILGETSVGFGYYVSHHWVLSCGYQFANPHGQSSNSLVLELTYVPSATEHKKIFKQGHAHHHIQGHTRHHIG